MRPLSGTPKAIADGHATKGQASNCHNEYHRQESHVGKLLLRWWKSLGFFSSAAILIEALDTIEAPINRSFGVTGFVVSTPVAAVGRIALDAGWVLLAGIPIRVVLFLVVVALGPNDTPAHRPNDMASLVVVAPMASRDTRAIVAVLVARA